ncbi:MAG: hypothetical protein ACPGVB_15530 [Chitinophagales bacterium]
MKEYLILEEKEVSELLSISLAIETIEKCFYEKAAGTFLALPKVNIAGKNGDLRITPGESQKVFNTIGFRLYDVIRSDFSEQPQVIITYNNESGKLNGIVISQLLGAYRTAAINAVIQKYAHTKPVERMGIVGTGYQAWIHTLMLNHTLRPKKILIYGRTKSNLDAFVQRLNKELNGAVEIEACGSIEELRNVNALLLATRSKEGLLDEQVFDKKMVITTIGLKAKGCSEVSNRFAESCDLILTDAIEQVHKYGNQFFVEDLSKVIDFSEMIVDGIVNRQNFEDKKILICSVGMGGTEVALANELIRLKKRQILKKK